MMTLSRDRNSRAYGDGGESSFKHTDGLAMGRGRFPAIRREGVVRRLVRARNFLPLDASAGTMCS